MKSTFLGTFDSEKFLRNQRLAKLPSMIDVSSEALILAMDELQFVFCEKGDALITRFAMDKAHKNYLSEIGYSFVNNEHDLVDRKSSDITSKSKSIFQLLLETDRYEYFCSIIRSNSEMSPFSVTPFTFEAANKYGMKFDAPSMDTICNVNSKLYSTKMKNRIGISNTSVIVKSSEELSEVCSKYLKKGEIIIKDEFGVSGKGNIRITSLAILKRIVSYLENQEKKGMSVSFIIEPFLEKSLDFSSQFFITKSGEINILSIQQILNNGFAYQGSFTADWKLLETLNENNYFEKIENIAMKLFEDGYFGHICVDSMILKNGEVIPLVEINARKSMSLLKYYIDTYLKKDSLQGNFTYLPLSYQGDVQFSEILEKLDKQGLLFTNKSNNGILPLSANSLFINRDRDGDYSSDKTYKGRLYYSAISNNISSILEITSELRLFMQNNNFKIID